MCSRYFWIDCRSDVHSLEKRMENKSARKGGQWCLRAQLGSCKLNSDVNFVTLCLANLFRDFFACFVILRHKIVKLQNQEIFGIIFQISIFIRIEYFRSLWLIGFQNYSWLFNVTFWIKINEAYSLLLNHRRLSRSVVETMFFILKILPLLVSSFLISSCFG